MTLSRKIVYSKNLQDFDNWQLTSYRGNKNKKCVTLNGYKRKGGKMHPVNLSNTIRLFLHIQGWEVWRGGGGALENKPHVLNKRISPNRAAIIEVLFSCFFVILKVFMEAKSIKLNHPLRKLRKLCTWIAFHKNRHQYTAMSLSTFWKEAGLSQ